MGVTLVLAILSSCASSNGAFSKRKYTKGVHISQRKISPSVNEEILVAESKMSIKTAAPNESKNSEVAETVESETILAEVVTSNEFVESKKVAALPQTKRNNLTGVLNYSNPLVGLNKTGSKTFVSRNSESIIKNSSLSPKIQKISEKRMTDEALLYYILAIILPFLAVGLVTDWDITKVLITVLLCFLFWLPGAIYALITVSQNV